MGSFGERMQREREMRSITLEAIAESTKISTRNLRALEQEKFSQLPGGIFNKGFVRAYARFLGIDAEQAVSDFLSAQAEDQDRAMAAAAAAAAAAHPAPASAKVITMRAAAEPQEEPAPDPGASFLKALVILVFILGAGGFAFRFVESRTGRSAAAAPPRSQVAAQASPSSSSPSSSSSASSAASQVATSHPATAKPSTKPSTMNPAAVPAATSADPTPAVVAADSSAPVPDLVATSIKPLQTAPLASPIAIDVQADEDSWIQVKADGQVMMEGVLGASAQKQFQAKKELAVKMGNAEAVQIVFNGQSLPRFGPEKNKNTRTLVFTPSGLRNP